MKPLDDSASRGALTTAWSPVRSRREPRAGRFTLLACFVAICAGGCAGDRPSGPDAPRDYAAPSWMSAATVSAADGDNGYDTARYLSMQHRLQNEPQDTQVGREQAAIELTRVRHERRQYWSDHAKAVEARRISHH